MDELKVKKVIDEWDPLDLLSHAPKDEYNGEVLKVIALINDTMEANSVGKIIFNVFTNAFDSDTFKKDINECVIIAQHILDEHRNAR